jgi:hypothetical protein
MAADGTWNLTMDTPMGERRSTLTLSTAGGTLTGKQEAEGNTTDIAEGTVNGNNLSWKVSITNPMPLTLTFNGTVEGNNLTGTADTGMFGSFPSRARGRSAKFASALLLAVSRERVRPRSSGVLV